MNAPCATKGIRVSIRVLIGISTDNIVHCFVWSGIVNTNPIPLVEKNDPHAIGALIPLFLAHACLENAGSMTVVTFLSFNIIAGRYGSGKALEHVTCQG